MRSLLLAAAALLPLAACEALGPASDYRELAAVIQMDAEQPAQVVLPASVRAGQEFTVQVSTYGGGCIRKGPTEVEAHGLVADVYPFDLYPADENTACTRELRTLEHRASVRIDQPGAATINVYGRRMPTGEAVVSTYTLTVTAAS